MEPEHEAVALLRGAPQRLVQLAPTADPCEGLAEIGELPREATLSGVPSSCAAQDGGAKGEDQPLGPAAFTSSPTVAALRVAEDELGCAPHASRVVPAIGLAAAQRRAGLFGCATVAARLLHVATRGWAVGSDGCNLER